MQAVKTDKKLLIISHDKIGSMMAGPGIRYHHMAEYLSSDINVTIGFFDPTYLPTGEFSRSYAVRSIDAYSFEDAFKEYDYIIALWLSDSMMNYCNVHDKVVIFDIYAPVPVEDLAVKLFSHRKITKDIDFDYGASLVMYRKFLENGDLFLYSNERQLNFWLGYIFGALQIIPSQYNKRPMYERFIQSSMGIDTRINLKKSKSVLKGKLGSIKKTDTVLLWTGGIWDWFDAVSLIEAMKILKQKGRTDIKLVFLGTQHPNSSVPKMAEVSRARDSAETNGLIDDTVYFLDGWIGYADRINYLLEADIAVYAHKPSIETEFSHRTRVLDHFLAKLPTIGTRGDYLGDIIEKEKLGIMVDPMNPSALAKAIVDCSEKEMLRQLKSNVTTYRKNFDWMKTLEPLRNYLLSDPTKIQRLPSKNTPLSKQYIATIKKMVPRPIKKIVKKSINSVVKKK